MKKRSISIFIVSLSLLFSQELVDRFKVPVNIKTKIGFGYDSNFLRLSDRDIESGNAYDYGILSTVDSPIIKPTVKLIYSPILFKNHLTNLISSFSYSYYNAAKEKSYMISNFSLEYKIKPYSWVKFGIRDIPKYYIRNFMDLDDESNEYQECIFSSQIFFSSYSFPLRWLKKTWVKVQYVQTNEFYNSNFTEFDLKKYLIQLELNHKMKSKNNIRFSISSGKADNLSFNNSSLVSTYVDRSYVFENIYLSFTIKKHDLKKIDKFGISNFLENRYYEMNLPTDDDLLLSNWNFVEGIDAWDGWKGYVEGKSIFWIDWDLFDEIKIKTSYGYRWRKAEYELYENMEWIADIKNYGKHEIWLEFSYKFITDLLY